MKTRPKTSRTKIIIYGLFVFSLISSLVAERFIKVHGMFGLDGRVFFHAWFGLISCVVIVLFSKFLGLFLKRKEDYYKESRND